MSCLILFLCGVFTRGSMPMGSIIAAPLIPKCVPVFYPFCIKSRVGSKCLSRPRNRRKICICIPADKIISIFRRSWQRIWQVRLLFLCYLTATIVLYVILYLMLAFSTIVYGVFFNNGLLLSLSRLKYQLNLLYPTSAG